MDDETVIWIGCVVGAVVIMLGLGAFFSYRYSDGGWAEWKRRIKEWHDPQVTEVLEMQRGIVLRPGAKGRTHSWIHQTDVVPPPVPGLTQYGDKSTKDSTNAALNPARSFPPQNLNSYPSITTEHSDDTMNMHDSGGKTTASPLDGWTNVELDQRAAKAFPGAPLIIARQFVREDIMAEARQMARPSYDRYGRLVTGEDAPSAGPNDMPASPSAQSISSTQRAPQPASPSTASTARTLRPAGQNLAKHNTYSTLASSQSDSSWTDAATSVTPDVPEEVHLRSDWRAQRQKQLFRRVIQKGYSQQEAQDILMGKRKFGERNHPYATETSFNTDLEA